MWRTIRSWFFSSAESKFESDENSQGSQRLTIFSRTDDLAEVARCLRQMDGRVEIDGRDNAWRNAIIRIGAGKQAHSITFTYSPDYCTDPNWSQQMNGMMGYFSRFPATDRQQKTMLLIGTFKIAIGVVATPEFKNSDPRFGLVFQLAQGIDGVVFTPPGLLDAHGRTLFSDDPDDEDPEAVWPRVVGEIDISSPLGQAMHLKSSPHGMDDGSLEPPAPQRIGKRTLALTAVTARAILEQDKGSREAPNDHKDLLAWIQTMDIDDEFEPDEWRVIQTPVGKLELRDQINSTWRLEGLAVLAWSLGLYEVPPHDGLVDTNALWRSIGFHNSPKAKAVIADPRLRSRDEILAMRRRLFTVHWRLRSFHISPKAMNFVQFAATCNFGPMDLTGLPIKNNDLVIAGKRIDQADRDAFSNSHSAATERHLAINWLWEGPERYSESSVST